ncbi:TIGR03767 family metallophosphoesterase [Nocardioides sp.]|uniref:TIGR03767 family metallophosphoesterase n=1 Tax=Nocardioides sp. TaxID=35761 RepID=UPI003783E208
MQLSRRDLFRSSLVVGGAAALGGLGSLSADAVAGTGVHGAAARSAGRTTTRTTVLGKGPAGAGGWRPVVALPGESWVVRTGLGANAKKGRAARRKAVLAFAQLSDVHVVDAQSPIRVEYGEGVSSSAYRPQEILSGQVMDAMVRELNTIGAAPVTGRPLAFAIQTGDNSDSTQYNEIRWNIDVLDGETVRVDSGDLTKYEGVMDQVPAFYDTMFWHPDGTPEGKEDDVARAQYGFPTIPGLLDAARQPFDAEGLAIPWYAAMGNHDGLVQGNFPATDSQRAKAIGDKKQTSKGERTVTADPDRRLLERVEWVQEHFTTTSTPVGHGFTEQNVADETAYYTFDQGKVRFIVLDTVSPFGDKGYLDATQLAWLKKLLGASRRKLVVIASHHPLASFSDKTLAAKIERLLVGYDNVIAWVNGHTHTNNIWPHVRKEKGKAVGGFWEINTASHIDWPQQSRLLEVTDNKDGTVSIFATMVDHGAPLEFNGDLDDPAQLAGLSRLLAANDWQERDNHRLGKRTDRNVELLVVAPKFLR